MANVFIKEPVKLLTIRDMLRWMVSNFNAAGLYYGHGTDNPWDEALQLLLTSIYLPMDTPNEFYQARMTLEEKRLVTERVVRRINERIPVAYLTQCAWFCGHEFYVDERVLIPRSPIGEWITKRFQGILTSTVTHVLDLCTGSGCIAIACAYAFPEVEVDAVDISEEALKVAEYNIQYHNMENRVTPILSDLFKDLIKFPYDIIVTNPPYVPKSDMAFLPREFHYEPKIGLEAGNGLSIVVRILAMAADYLSDHGILILEIGDSIEFLLQQFPNLPITCLELQHGGKGVLMLTKQQLISCSENFVTYRD